MLVLRGLYRESDVKCKSELRVNRRTFNIICEMLRDIGGLSGTKNMSLQEIVAMFLYTLAHHKKNRSIGQYFFRSGETNCLGALDGTYINVNVPSQERPKYRTRKGTIAMNVLGVCAPNMQFIYVLPGWEGSAHDMRVLQNALSRPNGFRVPRGYTNCEGFLAPYRGQRYHLKEWTDRQPESAEEFYNMKHARARNVIERCFGLLKGRWSILRSPSFFPIRTHGRIVMACCLLHNLIRKFMPTDDIKEDELSESDDDSESDSDDEREFITSVATSDHWTNFRNTLAQDMFNDWRMEASQAKGEASNRGRGKNKRYWTYEKDTVLIRYLHELSGDPKWKCENGFKNGYMNKLEEMINRVLPNCGLRAVPHIESRIKHWSEKYSALAEMLSTSGFGWDVEKKILQVDKSVFDG
ncbi:protein ALP1-like [Chenopodium quinoa]|uniref:protein ALP1-like n=1 Tax=Chenopodium quinoa TaxID=63459 RepID=UPI000B775E9E|nr:protein ALP1-like [Chenopodium quinoa]